MTTMFHPDHPVADARPVARSERSRFAGAILGTALLLGVAGDALAREFQPGAGWAVTLSLLIAAIAGLARWRGGLTAEQRAMLVPAIFLAESFAWRDAGGLFFFNLVALLVSLAALAMSLSTEGGWSTLTSGFRGLIRACLHAAASVAVGGPQLALADVDARDFGSARRLGAVGRGLLLTVPLLIVFGALLMSADPLYERLVTDLVDVDLASLVQHTLVVGALTWIAGGYLRGALLVAPTARLDIRRVALGGVEVGMALGTLALLFLSFLLLQARYLFGGARHVLETAGLTYADYARGGFFELMFVAALALPVLLIGLDAVRDDARARRVAGRIGALLAAEVGVMLLSAAGRMRLYVQQYGLTEDRIYASAAMCWLAMVFVAFYFTVLRGRPERLGGVALVGAWLTLGALNVANPPALIAKANVARAREGKPLDGRYLGRLGAGAVPHALAAIPLMSAAQRCGLATGLLFEWSDTPDRGWREWNKARAEARALVAARRAELERYLPTREGESCPPEAAPAVAATGAHAAAAVPAPGTAWWNAGAAQRDAQGIRVSVPASVVPLPATPDADQAAALRVMDEWFAATSFAEGGQPDWARLGRIATTGLTIAPPRAELPATSERWHGMVRTPLARSVRVAGDLAQGTATYELRHAAGGPVVGRGLVAFELQRAGDGAWRLTRAAWDQPASAEALPPTP